VDPGHMQASSIAFDDICRSGSLTVGKGSHCGGFEAAHPASGPSNRVIVASRDSLI
jgi:hypothetical protein